MRAVYAHFPINSIIQENGHAVEIRNFLGEKVGIVAVLCNEELRTLHLDCATRQHA